MRVIFTQRICSMKIPVRCPNQACGQMSQLPEDGLNRVFRCPSCRTKLTFGASVVRARETPIYASEDSRLDAEFDSNGPGPLLSMEAGQSPPRAEPSELERTCRLGRLQLRDRLGAGSFATIYHAFDPLLERDVTLKIFHAAEEDCCGDNDHFSTEVKALARLRHPRIVAIYDAGREGDYRFIAMEFIEGRTLAELLSEGP